MTRLKFDEIKKLIESNNKSGDLTPSVTAVSTELLLALIWKESSYDPDTVNSGSSATGLMQITKGAVSDVNNNTPAGIHFDHSDMKKAEKNIQCGTYYLALKIKLAGNVATGLDNYGTGAGYSTNILACEKCLKGLQDPSKYQDCLDKIHT